MPGISESDGERIVRLERELAEATRMLTVVVTRDGASVKVGDGSGPWCVGCGLDLSLSPEQIAYVMAHGNPVPRPSCPANPGSGLHRVPDPHVDAEPRDEPVCARYGQPLDGPCHRLCPEHEGRDRG